MGKTLFCSGIAALVFFGCSKSGSSPATANQPALVGKWTVANIIDWTAFGNGQYLKDTVAGDPGEYMDFQSNGKIYSYDWYEGGIGREFHYDTLTYQVSGNLVVITNNQGWVDSATIQQQTANSVTLYFKGLSGRPDDSVWDFLSK